VLTPEETLAWRSANLQHHQRDIAVLTDESVDIDYLCDVLARITPAVVFSSVHEPSEGAWLMRYGMRNKLLRLTIFGDRDPDACLAEVTRSLHLFGIRTASR
jgi:ferredoxin-fold anticodon binding domain-containing protein